MHQGAVRLKSGAYTLVCESRRLREAEPIHSLIFIKTDVKSRLFRRGNAAMSTETHF